MVIPNILGQVYTLCTAATPRRKKDPIMRILALSGSPSAKSINQDLLNYAAALTGADVDGVSIRDFPAPLFSRDLEAEAGFPQGILDLKARIEAADAVVIASPEHNGGMPAALKNTFDWLSRVAPGKPWLKKPLVLLSASPGPNGGKTNLGNLAPLVPYWGAELVGTYSVGRFYDQFSEGELTDPKQISELSALMTQLVEKMAVSA